MQANDSFRLVVRRGPQPNQVYELTKDAMTIGRDITNDITINDPEVSRHHLRFTRGAGGYSVEDLGSTNGTFINGQRLTGARALNNGDMIGLGETVTLGYEAMRPMMAPGPVGAEMPTTASPVPPRQQPGVSPVGMPPSAPSVAPSAPAYQPPVYSAQQPAAYGTGQPAPQPPPGAGYDYDPYAIREEEPRNTARWIAIGCVGLTLFCCCATIGGLWLIDALCLWNRLPIISDIIRAIGWSVSCPT